MPAHEHTLCQYWTILCLLCQRLAAWRGSCRRAVSFHRPCSGSCRGFRAGWVRTRRHLTAACRARALSLVAGHQCSAGPGAGRHPGYRHRRPRHFPTHQRIDRRLYGNRPGAIWALVRGARHRLHRCVPKQGTAARPAWPLAHIVAGRVDGARRARVTPGLAGASNLRRWGRASASVAAPGAGRYPQSQPGPPQTG